MTARALSLKVGRNETLIRKILAGTVPRGDNLAALAREIGLPAEALVPAEPGKPSAPSLPESNAVFLPDHPLPWPRPAGPMDVPVYGVAEGGQNGTFVINLAEQPIDYVGRPMSLLRAVNVFAVRIQGNSMAPLWESGDIVYVQPGRGYGPDDFVIVQIEDGPGEPPRSLFKQLVRQDDGALVLRQLNPDTTITVPAAEVRKVWPVLHWRELGW